MQLGARRLTLLEGLTCITQGGGGGGGVWNTPQRRLFIWFRSRKSTLHSMENLAVWNNLFPVGSGSQNFFLKSCLCSQFAQSVCLTDMDNKLLNLWPHDLVLYHNGLFTHPCSYPTVALLDAFFVFLNLPSLSFTPDFFDDDKALSEY